MKKNITLVCLVITLFFSLTGCSSKDQTQSLKEKNEKALAYIESNLFDISNNLNNIKYENSIVREKQNTLEIQRTSTESKSEASIDNSSENKEEKISLTEMNPASVLTNDQNVTDWNYIKVTAENLYASCSPIILDLYELGVSSEEILKLNENLDKMMIAVKGESKKDTFFYLVKVYELIPRYIQNYSPTNPNIYIYYAKAYLLNALYLIEEDNNWAEATNSLIRVDEYCTNLVNDIEFSKNKGSRVNKIYITLKELQNSMDLRDKEIFYIKYKIIMEELGQLS